MLNSEELQESIFQMILGGRIKPETEVWVKVNGDLWQATELFTKELINGKIVILLDTADE